MVLELKHETLKNIGKVLPILISGAVCQYQELFIDSTSRLFDFHVSLITLTITLL
jgi:hypothetical protein